MATLCLGAERHGLPDSVLTECQNMVTIQLRPEGAESLNVAAAAAIACERIASGACQFGNTQVPAPPPRLRVSEPITSPTVAEADSDA